MAVLAAAAWGDLVAAWEAVVADLVGVVPVAVVVEAVKSSKSEHGK